MSLERGRYRHVLGSLVERRRKQDKLTQEQLGKKVGVSQSVVCRIEKGTADVDMFTFDKLAGAIGISSPVLHKRVLSLANKVRAAEQMIIPAKIASRDTERKLIDYVVAVSN